jgi:hypothetical protein
MIDLCSGRVIKHVEDRCGNMRLSNLQMYVLGSEPSSDCAVCALVGGKVMHDCQYNLDLSFLCQDVLFHLPGCIPCIYLHTMINV